MTVQNGVVITREPSISGQVLFVGGHPGCGKTMLTPIIGALKRVEIQKFNYTIEHICCLRLLDKIDVDASSAMIRMLTDLDIYNMMMSRETNFRWKDLSSIFKNPNPWRYLRRLFYPGDHETIGRIQKENPILQITTHNLLVISQPLFEALKKRVRLIILIRHPLYMIKQWHLYVEMYGKDAREFTIWINYKGKSLPFFANGWEEKYLQSNTMEKSIYSIEYLTQKEKEIYQSLSSEEQSQVLMIPFEHFVLTPWPYLKKMERLLDTEVTTLTKKELKKQKVPRCRIADGIGLPIYKKYGWEPAGTQRSEREELEKRWDFAARGASPEALKVLEKICKDYEKEFQVQL